MRDTLAEKTNEAVTFRGECATYGATGNDGRLDISLEGQPPFHIVKVKHEGKEKLSFQEKKVHPNGARKNVFYWESDEIWHPKYHREWLYPEYEKRVELIIELLNRADFSEKMNIIDWGLRPEGTGLRFYFTTSTDFNSQDARELHITNNGQTITVRFPDEHDLIFTATNEQHSLITWLSETSWPSRKTGSHIVRIFTEFLRRKGEQHGMTNFGIDKIEGKWKMTFQTKTTIPIEEQINWELPPDVSDPQVWR